MFQNSIEIPRYNLRGTLLSGQTFVWSLEDDGTLVGRTSSLVLKFKKSNNKLTFKSNKSEIDSNQFIVEYLRLNEDYEDIVKRINKDLHLKESIKHYPNLRIIKQPFEDTVISFIISANSNIPKIKQSIFKIIEKYGEEVEIDGEKYRKFPSVQKLSEIKESQLKETGVGYRAKYIIQSAKELSNNQFATSLKNLDDKETHKELMKLSGVGPKVADCIMVYGMGYDHITPMDVWGKRILIKLYNVNEKYNYYDLKNWASEYFGGYAAWAGQFLYEYARNQLKLK